jgi:hypothetical protein
VLLEGARSVEEVLARHCEELGLVGGAVRIEQRVGTRGGVGLEGEEGTFASRGPRGEVGACGQGRRAVGVAVEHVELVGELVIDEVVSGEGTDVVRAHVVL